MLNYVVEDGIDFFAELNKKNDSDNDENLCLITNTKLLNNKITLPCNHTFNYLPLFFEVKNQKRYNPNEPYNLLRHQIRCPYCRQVSNKLLPYVPPSVVGKGAIRLSGVNSPDNLCMKHKTCKWVFKSGKKKGCECQKKGFETDAGDYCEIHWKYKKTEKTSENNENICSSEVEDLFKKNTIQQLKVLLRKKSLKVSGKKMDLVLRLINNK